MAIALPAPITPQLSTIEQVQAQAKTAWLVNYLSLAIHISGDLLVPEQDVRDAIAAADSISDAVRAIGAVFYREGYPATLVTYAVGDEQNLYVRVAAGHVGEVKGPDALLPYFRKLVSPEPLRDSQLEGARVLADSLTQRAGEQYQMELRPLDDGSVILDLGSASGGSEQLALEGSFSNYGNRYAGPYLANLSVRQSLSSGDEVVVGGTTDVHVFGLGGSHNRPYREGEGSWSRVTRFGVLGLQGSYASFGQDLEGVRLDGNLSSGAASWLAPLYADFDNRLLLQARFERNHEALDAELINASQQGTRLLPELLQILGLAPPPVTHAQVLSELYNSAELSLNGVARTALGSHSLELSGGVTARKGLSKSRNGQTDASLSYFLLRPSINLRFGLSDHLDLLGDAQFQLSNSVLPQQEQLVIGGPTSLHAYDAGVGVGDHGEDAHIAIEWHGLDDSWAARYHIRPQLFVEYGASTLEFVSSIDESAGHVRLADVGFSIEASPISALSATLSVAQSIYDHSDQGSLAGDSRKYVFFQLTGHY